MTRIIAGAAGSLSLAVPKSGTRPTSDRVREALFSALDARGLISGAVVLDLYAGSGALGLESASRGAGSVTLVENSRAAAVVCRKNMAAVTSALSGSRQKGTSAPRIWVAERTVHAFLNDYSETADIVFIDPPYELSEAALATDLELLLPHLSDDGVVVIERSSRSPEPQWPAGVASTTKRPYGDTVLWWAERTLA